MWLIRILIYSYIIKVQVHQDGSYLHVEPLKITGIWIALEDCTIENGTLYFLPGSHKGPLGRRFIRNPNKEEFNNGKYLIYTDDLPTYNEQDFVPVEIKAGISFISLYLKIINNDLKYWLIIN